MAFQVEFVSPESVLYSGQATVVVARTRGGGDIAFLTGHEPFIGSLQPSEVRVTEVEGAVKSFAVRSGFVSVTGEEVTVLSDEAVAASDIDVSRAQAELAAAQEELRNNPESLFAADDVRWAEIQLTVAGGGNTPGR